MSDLNEEFEMAYQAAISRASRITPRSEIEVRSERKHEDIIDDEVPDYNDRRNHLLDESNI